MSYFVSQLYTSNLFQDSEQAEGFTDIPKLIAEEDVDFLPYISWITPKRHGKCLDYTDPGESDDEEEDDDMGFGLLSPSSLSYMPGDGLKSPICLENVEWKDEDGEDQLEKSEESFWECYDAAEECSMQPSPTVSSSCTNCSWTCFWIAFLDEATIFNARTE